MKHGLRVLAFAALATLGCHARPSATDHAAVAAGVPFASTVQQSADFGAPSWGNGQSLCLDPAATTTCSGGGAIADTNDCTCTCNAVGVGPCIHWYTLLNRWQGSAPRITSSAGIPVTFLTSQTTFEQATDPVYLSPQCYSTPTDGSATANVGWVHIIGTKTTLTTTTISAITQKNRTTPQALRVTLASGGGKGILYVNTTHPSSAYSRAGIAGGSNTMSQPILCTAPNSGSYNCNEVGWLSGDTIVTKSLPSVAITNVTPLVHYMGFSEGGGVYVDGINVLKFAGEDVGDTPLTVGPWVSFQDCTFEHNLALTGTAIFNGGSTFYGIANGYIKGAIQGGQAFSQWQGSGTLVRGFSLTGGILDGNALPGSEGYTLHNAVLDSDVVLAGGNLSLTGATFIGTMENEGTIVDQEGAVDIQAGALTGTSILWGTGTYDSGRGATFYGTGATGGATTFPSGGLLLAGGSTACLEVPSSVLTTLVCNKSITNGASLDSGGLGATTGFLGFGPLGFTNAPF
jgi:hypothetical protein